MYAVSSRPSPGWCSFCSAILSDFCTNLSNFFSENVYWEGPTFHNDCMISFPQSHWHRISHTLHIWCASCIKSTHTSRRSFFFFLEMRRGSPPPPPATPYPPRTFMNVHAKSGRRHVDLGFFNHSWQQQRLRSWDRTNTRHSIQSTYNVSALGSKNKSENKDVCRPDAFRLNWKKKRKELYLSTWKR